MKTFTRKEQIDINSEDEDPNVSSNVSENPENPEREENSDSIKELGSGESDSDTPPANEGTSQAQSTTISDLLGDVPSVTTPDSDVAESLEPQALGDENEASKGPVDVDGRHFDPDLHLSNPDGSPRVSDKTGKLLKKRGRRKASDSNGYLDGDINNSEAKAVAETYFNGFKLLGSALLGGEFGEHTKPEGEMVTKAIEAVCIESNSTGLTPKQMLGVALMSYTAPRVTTPTAKERLGLYWFRIKKLFKRKNPEEPITEEEA